MPRAASCSPAARPRSHRPSTRISRSGVCCPSGDPDTSFGAGGVALTDLSGLGSYDGAVGLDVDAQGRILVGGLGGPQAGYLVRYLAAPGPDDLDADGFEDPTTAAPIGTRRTTEDAPSAVR